MRTGLILVTYVPLAKASSSITLCFQDFTQSSKGRVQPFGGGPMGPKHLSTAWIAAGEQCGPGGRTNSLGHMKIEVAGTVAGQGLDMGGGI